MAKSVLVIGGTSGLGQELACQAVDLGFSVTVLGRNAAYCRIVQEKRARPLILDLSQRVYLSEELEPFDVVFWNAGAQQKGPFINLNEAGIRMHCRGQLESPLHLLNRLLKVQHRAWRALHLVVIGSSTSWRVRENESLYGALKAAQAHLARALGKELPRDLPGSKVLLAHPGAMATPFWANDHQTDTGNFMKPEAVAKMIWGQILAQEEPFREIQIVRQPDGSPRLEQGARLPQM